MQIIYAECKECGQRYHGWTVEEVKGKMKAHVCMDKRLKEEIDEILERVLGE